MASAHTLNDTATIEVDPSEFLPEDTDTLVEDDELLVEEVSIDGMCGVY